MGPSSGERGEREETRRDTGGSRLGKKKERQRTAPRDKACNPVGEELLRKGGGGQLEEEFVVKVYDRIARHFSHTRYKPWPKVHAFLESLPRYSLVVDVGCGNGKYLQSLPQSQRRPLQDHLSSLSLHESSATISSKDPLASSSSPSPRLSSSSSSSSLSSSISDSSSSPPHHPGISNPSPTPSSFSASSVVSQAVLAGSDPGDCLVIGVDISIPLLEIACQRAHASGRVAAATCLNTNLREGIADAAVSIAVIHHLSTEGRRTRALEELRRITKRGGLILITVWAETQEEGSVGARDFKGKDVFVPWHLQKKLDLRPSENIPSESNGSRKKECNGGEHGSVGDSFGRGDAEGKDSAHQSNCNGQSTHSRLGRVAEAVKSVKGEDGISDEKELTVPTRNRQAADETEGHVSQRDSERTARRHDARSPPGTVALENLLEPGAIADGRAQGLKDIGTSSGRDSQYFGNHDLVGKDAQVSGREEKSDTNSLSHKGNPDSVSSDQQSKDCMEPKDDESGITTLFRYYHVFSKEEILGLCRQVDGLEVVECYFDANNWGVILRKT